ncbi:sodium channel protein Nach [Glossina fuscipes]|uniref:Sodium channel protein Nach n=1 Tax=Glossina fuscipes TaxID=7396 RepID=A0A8U0WL97_9MUSC|nr:sodium channel protein Nach [Glossina fuscipes]
MNTKVSGVWLLRREHKSGPSRSVWTFVLISLLLMSIYLSLQLWLQFYSYPIVNTISNDLLITNIPFPGVTACSPKVVNSERANRFAPTLKLPINTSLQEVAEGFGFLNLFTDQTWLPPNHTSYKVTDDVLRLNNITILEAATQVGASCNDFVKHCFWGSDEFLCHQNHEYLSFIPTTSYLGPCCSFNYNPRNLSYIPFAANTFGIDSGLSFIGVEGSERSLSTGLIIHVHHPMDFATEAAASVTITSNSESFIQILPTVQSASTEVLKLAHNKRDCLTSNDLDLSNYRKAACSLSCERDFIIEKCHCQPYHLFNEETNYRECKLNDSLCYMENYEAFKTVQCKDCLPNCHDVTYATSAYNIRFQSPDYSINSMYTNKKIDFKDAFTVHIYFARQTVPAVYKVIITSWFGLISDLGGVFNLCLGLSMISLIEFFYYIIYCFGLNLKARQTLIDP